MGLLGHGLVLGLACASTACYSPELRDCTLACTTANECAEGQVCGADRFCASPEMAGRCTPRSPRDGGVSSDPDGDITQPPSDARPIDAGLDAATHGSVTFTMAGKGLLVIDGHGTCDSDPPQSGACVFIVPLATPVTVEAFADDDDWRFDKWTTSECPDEDNRTCTFQPALSTLISVKFRRDG